MPLSVAALSCTPEAYRREADRDVYRILHERKTETLGYEPQAKASDAPAPKTVSRDYRKIPATPLAPAMPPAVETPAIGQVPYGTQGPSRDVFVQDLQTGESRRLTNGGFYRPPAFAPHGERGVFCFGRPHLHLFLKPIDCPGGEEGATTRPKPHNAGAVGPDRRAPA